MKGSTYSEKISRTLPAQLIFTALAFLVMAILSYLFMSSIVRGNLVRNADSILNLTEDRITATLLAFESTFDGFASDTSALLKQGESNAGLTEYMESISHFRYLDGKKEAGIQDFYGYLETDNGPALIHSSLFTISEDYRPEEQDWYRQALAADGGTIETSPYINANNETLYTYAKCLYDDSGRRLGIICMDVKIDLIGQTIVDTSLSQGGYGLLVSQNGLVLFHPFTDFRGRDIHDPTVPFSIFSEAIDANREVIEEPLVTFRNEDAVAFIRTLHNGWHLGLVTPEAQYYQSISSMGLVLGLLAAALAGVLIIILFRLDAARAKSDIESQQKSAFLANMSHEIRTPLNAIVGMTAIGRAAGLIERKDYCFTKIDEASRHLLGVINDILDISKIEANKIELSPTDFSFEKMLQQVVNVINFRIDEKKQNLTIYIDKDIPKVIHADEQRLAQVLTNLLGNAVKFTHEAGIISLKASLIGKEGDNYSIHIEVKDNGIGLSPEQQSKLFQSFQQAESSTTRKYGGTGLGLAISQSIVEMMGGKIELESALGQGSAFSFTITVTGDNNIKYGLADHGINWRDVRILTIDDDPDIREYFKEIVSGFGANCKVAGGAGEALHLIDENGGYNIYFVDLKMPGVDGLALTREIRSRETKPGNSIVIMISSADLSAVEEDAKAAGVDKFLVKPIFPSSIADTISECIGLVNERAEEVPQDINGIFDGHRILFAEDVDINREIVISLLEPTNLAIECAENGAEAVKMFLRDPERYDLIFMDVQMPEMDGYEATRQIRSQTLAKAKEIPIIAMTANVFKEDVEKCLNAGMNGHLGKPLDMNNMLSVLMKYFRKQ